jgi:hypothetical protein
LEIESLREAAQTLPPTRMLEGCELFILVQLRDLRIRNTDWRKSSYSAGMFSTSHTVFHERF